MTTRTMTARNASALRTNLGSKAFDRMYRFVREQAMRATDGVVRTFVTYEVR